MMSGSLDACAIWSPNTAVVTSEMDGDAFVMCSNTTFSDIAADCCSWIVTPDYATANEDLLVRFTKALYKGMDFGCKEENYETVAGYVAELCGTDKDTALGQTGDGAWLDAATLVGYVEDGTVEGYYEVQQKGFIDSGKITAEEGTDVSNYVLFDIMTKAAA